MKKITLFILILAFNSSLIAQKKPYIIASYSYSNYNLKEFADVELQILHEESLSIFKRIDSTKSKAFIDDSGVGRFDKVVNDQIGKKVYKNLTKKELVFRDYATNNGEFSPYIVKEKLPILNWKFISSQKKIGKFTCKAASLKFRGRDYIAWYTTEIPINHGPWKFYGLPGLIVEISSKDNNIKFRLKKISRTVSPISKIDIPENGKKITFKEYVSYKNSSTDEFLKKIYAKLPRGAKIKVNSITNHNIEKEFN